MRICTLILGLVLAAGCGGEDDRPATWSYIHPAVIQPNCATVSCHSKDNAQAGIRLHSPASAYSALVGRACGGTTTAPGQPSGNFVAPGDPNRSRLVHLLLGEEVSRSMPPDRLLPMADVELIEEWILGGALCD